MNSTLRTLIQNVSRDEPLGIDSWKTIIQGLLDDFRHYLGVDFEVDLNPMIEVSAPTIVQWIWSKPVAILQNEFLAVTWSGVLAGNLVDDESGLPYFAASVTIFLFSALEFKRLYTHD